MGDPLVDRMRKRARGARARWRLLALPVALPVALAALVSGCSGSSPKPSTPSVSASPSAAPSVPIDTAALGDLAANVIPKPQQVTQNPSGAFAITKHTTIAVQRGDAGVDAVGQELAALLRPSTGFPLPIVDSPDPKAPGGVVSLALGADDAQLGDEGYILDVDTNGVTMVANRPAGLFHAVQTLRQLLPPQVEKRSTQEALWAIPGGHIVDYPRYPYRGAMLDVARHFFPVADVEKYIDDSALYKINYLHLHLSDDQGWRIAIDGWPELTKVGGSTQVGGGAPPGGGFYTQDQYRQIVAYAQARYVTIVPEIETPGHVNAALASYAELNCDGKAPALYTGTNVGRSSLCVGKPVTYSFLDDVVSQLAAMTPGPYIHLGGDEAAKTSDADYVAFEQKAQQIIAAHGKTMIGWDDIGKAPLAPGTVAQYWNLQGGGKNARAAAAQGAKLIFSPSDKTYLDQKYDAATRLGLTWAGPISVQDSYGWDPAALGIAPESSILGVEAPLWSETLKSIADIEYMAFPRLPGIAEVGWSAEGGRDWTSYAGRLGAQGPRWTALGIAFYAAPGVPWAS